ncbi:MAG: hypothetical protein KAU28_04840 [Phycisphaerae bacterium]|nr:hypothetical protein [Phycisphaerae bacterium]
MTSQGPEMSSAIDPRFSRARYFVVVETDTGDFSAVDNSVNLNAIQGAGARVPQW